MIQGKKFPGTKIITPEARLSYPNLLKARGFQGQEEKFSAVFLFNKKTDIKKMRKLARQKLDEAFGPFRGEEATKWPKGFINPFKNGDGPKHAGKPGYENTYVVSSNSKYAPTIVDTDATTRITKESDLYPGCYVRAELYCKAFDYLGKKGVTFGLNHVQKLRNGEPLGGSGSVNGVFDAVESTEDDDYGNESEDDNEGDDNEGGF